MAIVPGDQAQADAVAGVAFPRGRLSLAANDPIPTADQIGKSTLYWRVFSGLWQPVYGGSPPSMKAVGYAPSLSLSLASYQAGEILDIFAVRSGGTPGLQALSWGTANGAKGMALTNATNATPIVVTAAGHGLTTGAQVYINGVQGNLAANGVWTITYVDANNFSLDTSVGSGAYTAGGYFSARNATNMSSWAQLGVAAKNPNVFTRYLTAIESLYLGTVKMSAAGQCEDSMAKRFVWNAWNQVPRPLYVPDTTASWSYTTATLRQARAAAANQIEFVTGGYGMVHAEINIAAELASNTGPAIVSFGLGAAVALNNNVINNRGRNAAASVIETGLSASLKLPFSGGYCPLWWLEYGAGAGTCNFLGGTRGISGFVMA